MVNEATVFVVDDDERVREAVAALATSMGVSAESFASAEEFLESADPPCRGCLVTDIRMQGMSGLELQRELGERGIELSVVVITGFARTPLIVQAMQHGAITVLEKPCDDQELWDAIGKGLRRSEEQWTSRARKRSLDDRFVGLTDGERVVLEGMVKGKSNKSIARELDVSTRTVETRRQNVFQKTRTSSLAELVWLACEARLFEIN